MATIQKEKAFTQPEGKEPFEETVKKEAVKAKELIKDAASYVGQKAEDATAAVGSGIESLGGTIRDKGPHAGVMGSAGAAVADTLETSGRYLQDKGLTGMADDLTNTIRRHPIPSLLIGIGIGILMARALGR